MSDALESCTQGLRTLGRNLSARPHVDVLGPRVEIIPARAMPVADSGRTM